MIKIKEFGRILKNIRLGNNLNQEDVEFLTGISTRSLSRLENGKIKNISVDNIIELSSLYGEDLLDIYYKNLFEIRYLYEDIINSLGVASIFIGKNEVETLSKKLSIVENDNKIIGKEKDIKLLRLFIDRIQNNEVDKFVFKERYEDITSKTYTKSNVIDRKYSTIEMRILVNICNDFKEYKSFSNYEILDKLSQNCNNSVVKMLIYNSIINRLYIDYRSKGAIKLITKAINEAITNKDLEALSMLYYDKFICELDLGYETYGMSIKYSKMCAKLSGLVRLNETIERKYNSLILK